MIWVDTFYAELNVLQVTLSKLGATPAMYGSSLGLLAADQALHLNLRS